MSKYVVQTVGAPSRPTALVQGLGIPRPSVPAQCPMPAAQQSVQPTADWVEPCQCQSTKLTKFSLFSGVNVLPSVAEAWEKVRSSESPKFLVASYVNGSKVDVGVLHEGDGSLLDVKEFLSNNKDKVSMESYLFLGACSSCRCFFFALTHLFCYHHT